MINDIVQISDEKRNFFEFLIRLASLYYLEGKTQAKVAQELGISRQKVQRLLQQARELGIVETISELYPRSLWISKNGSGLILS